MKIALVSPYDYAFPGGVTFHIAQLARQFLQAGHQLKILAPCSSRNPPSPHLIPLGRPLPVPSGGSIARITLSFWLQPRIKAMLNQENFDIVHCHEPLTPLLPPLVLEAARCPRLGTFHACHEQPRGYGLTRRVLQRWFQRLDGLIAVSIPARDFISQHFPGDYEIIPNGVDLEQYRPDTLPLAEFQDGKLNILFVGRLEKRKGVDYLLRAFAQLKGEGRQVRLIIVGPGTRLRKGYEKIAREIGDVVFAGYVPNPDLPRYYASAHVFCAPATGEESFGMVLLEAMAMGRPVVATAILGFSQLVSPGEDGLLVPPRDETALASALRELLDSPALARKMGEKGREKAKGYSWDLVAGRVLAFYRRYLKDGSG